jgi:fumarylacetoacetate (FAA) hydrolase
MRLCTVRDGSRDGALAVVRFDGAAIARAGGSLQGALDEWDVAEPQLRALAVELDSGRESGEPLAGLTLDAPLPRAYEWVDGSAYINHVILVRKARNAEPPETLRTDPLVYQGGSGALLGPQDPIPLVDASWGLDFEAEVVIILGDVPLGTRASDAGKYVRLVTLANDVTLRNLVPAELAKSFGFFQSKPATAFGPFAVTPDELGAAWRDGRLYQRVRVMLNDELVGDCDAGPEMHFSFHDLIGHIAKTRGYTAGTLLGSGTVSNADRARGISCLAERRALETIDTGKPQTCFLTFGDRVTIEVINDAGRSIFGRIAQEVKSI